MKVTKWIEYSTEVEVDVSAEDIANAIAEETDSPRAAMYAINRIATVMRGVTDEVIAGMTPKHRELVHNFLAEQLARYATAAESV